MLKLVTVKFNLFVLDSRSTKAENYFQMLDKFFFNLNTLYRTRLEDFVTVDVPCAR